MAFPAVMMLSGASWSSMSPEERQILTEVATGALASGSARKIEAEQANLEALRGRITVTEPADGATALAAANAAVQASRAGFPLIAAFRAQVADPAR